MVIHIYAFAPAGLHDEIEMTLAPRRWPVSEEGTKPPVLFLYVRIGSESEDSRKNGTVYRSTTGQLEKVSLFILKTA